MNLSEPLLLALLVQIKDDYDSLMHQVGMHEQITPQNHLKCGNHANVKLISTPGLWELQDQLKSKYTTYLNMLLERKFQYGQEEAR